MEQPTITPGDAVHVDAYTGSEAASGTFTNNVKPWALTRPKFGEKTQRPDDVDEADWRNPAIGWGVILVEPPDLTPAQLATADDAPEPIRELVRTRGGKVIRYRPDGQYSAWTLRDYAGDGDLLTSASPTGMGPKQLPSYLLICGSAREVPWQIQQFLNPVRHVGRLDLGDDGLANYVTALLEDWAGSASSYHTPVVWAVDHDSGDITTLMRDVVAQPLYDAFHGDDEMDPAFVDGSKTEATGAALLAALQANTPSLVVTSSHGMTGPLDNPASMAADLGVLVDQAHQRVSPDMITAAWQPEGAIWFAQACCSAGADNPTSYAGLFEPGTTLERVLTTVAQVGPMTSPLPRALLGAPRPLRAFVGHVEPTFNWTLSFPPNRQSLASDLTKCLYRRLCLGQPVGLAMSDLYPTIGTLLLTYESERAKYESALGDAAKSSLDMLIYSRVTAHDRASTVILGDPTVTLPLPGSGLDVSRLGSIRLTV